MRLRFAVLASLLTALLALSPSAATAAPRHNHGLTIAVAPTHILAGDGVVIYGQLKGSAAADQTIRLYHRVSPFGGYSLVGTTTTDAHGAYEFTRQEGVVLTNRSWFVRGPDQSHSRTVRVAVEALISLTADQLSPDTLHKVVLTGHVFPAHPFQRVLLQERVAGDDWHTVAGGVTGAGSSYRIVYRWRLAGERDVRVVLPADWRNTRSSSDPITLTVQQAENPSLTLLSSSPVIEFGRTVTLSGVLDKPGTSTADGGVPVTLMARPVGASGFTAVANTVTGTDGAYRFAPQSPATNTYYAVRVTLSPKRRSAVMFQGVKDVVSATASSSNSPVGGQVTFSGTVLPGHGADQVVYLQRLGKDGDWHTIKVGFTNAASAYSITWTLGHAGTDVFRARVLGDRLNLGDASPRMTVTVTPASSPAALAPAA